jgi:plastocyanin
MRWIVLLALAVLPLVACGGEDDSAASAPGGTGGGDVVEITLTDFAIDPRSLSLDPGKYTFHVVNHGGSVHALEVEGQSHDEVETEELDPGAAADLAVDLTEAGEYELYCSVDGHRDRGMEATARVGGGEGTTTEGTTTDEEPGYGY